MEGGEQAVIARRKAKRTEAHGLTATCEPGTITERVAGGEPKTNRGRFGHNEAWRTRMAKSSGEADSHETPWVVVKYWIAIASVIAILLAQAIFFFDGVVRNGQCTFAQHITFVCNRWDAAFKPWDTLTY